MWKYEPFLGFIEYLARVPSVGEIIIINNAKEKTPNNTVFYNPKVKRHDFPGNTFVNPAWNFGVQVSQFNKVCIMNDDIIVDLKLFDRVDAWLTEEIGVLGICPGKEGTGQPPFVNGTIDFVRWDNHNLYGFGGLFFTHKNNWVNIPDELKVMFGDNWVFDRNVLVTGKPNYLITNIFYHHAEAQTVKDFAANSFYATEEPQYQRIFNEMRNVTAARIGQ